MSGAEPALAFQELRLSFATADRRIDVLHGVSLEIAAHEAYGLVGESGCGKTTAAFAAVGHLPASARITGGSVRVGGREVAALRPRELQRMRASEIAMVYQDPSAALNPTLRIGTQVAEAFRLLGDGRGDAWQRARGALDEVRIADVDLVMRRYPHELSGGMLQRVVIAMALAKRPSLLILDEPTTALDVTTEAEVLELVAAQRAERGMSILLISHDLGAVGRVCDRVGVLYAGRIVEEGPVSEVLVRPRHPYTVRLLRAIPDAGARKDARALETIPGLLPRADAELTGCAFAARCAYAEATCREHEPAVVTTGDGHAVRCHFPDRVAIAPAQAIVAPQRSAPRAATARPLLRATDVRKTFTRGGRSVTVLHGVSLEVRAGETLGIVGESGSGKTTLARVLVGLVAGDDGSRVELDGRPLAPHVSARSRDEIRAMQIVFQHPGSALNRRVSVRRALARTLERLLGLRGGRQRERVQQLVEQVRFDPALLDARPRELSGGLNQRVAIARALAAEPRVVVCDEPTSALDVSVQAAILNLLARVQRDDGVAFVFISHDLAVVRYLADRIAVLYLGHVLEVGDVEQVFDGPHHPYTEALVSAVPSDGRPKPTAVRLSGETPSPAEPPSGCVFHTRCPRVLGDRCRTEEPPLREVEPGHLMACHIPVEELRRLQCAAAPAAAGAADAP